MGVSVSVKADELWGFCSQNRERLQKELVMIAENNETGYAVYVTANDERNFQIVVCKGGSAPEYSEYVLNAENCKTVFEKACLRYLLPVSVVIGENAETETDIDADTVDKIYIRDDELSLALCDFLQVVFQENEDEYGSITSNYGTAFIGEVLDDFLSYLADEHGLYIYRPTIVVDPQTGKDVVVEFPYNREDDDDEEIEEEELPD